VPVGANFAEHGLGVLHRLECFGEDEKGSPRNGAELEGHIVARPVVLVLRNRSLSLAFRGAVSRNDYEHDERERLPVRLTYGFNVESLGDHSVKDSVDPKHFHKILVLDSLHSPAVRRLAPVEKHGVHEREHRRVDADAECAAR
jgi:hypothetical protein